MKTAKIIISILMILAIIGLSCAICFAQNCKYTVFINQSIIKKDTSFCGNPNRVVSVMMDCDSSPDYASIFVLYLDGNLWYKGYEGDKFVCGCYGKYQFEEHRTYYNGKCTSNTLLRFSISDKKKCNCAEK